MDSPLVIVAGAGASANLGRDKPLPTMREWATDLFQELSPWSEIIGITPEMEGDQFEARIGAILRCARDLKSVSEFPALGLSSPQSGLIDEATRWFLQAQTAADEIERRLFESLHRLFGMG